MHHHCKGGHGHVTRVLTLHLLLELCNNECCNQVTHASHAYAQEETRLHAKTEQSAAV